MYTINYFCIVLGAPDPEGRNHVEDEIYHPVEHTYTTYPEVGDVLLFYCTGSYHNYAQQFPGIGIALAWQGGRKHLRYKYLPFQHPLQRDDVLGKLEQEEQHRLQHLNRWQNWFFALSRDSVVRVLADSEALCMLDKLVPVKPVRPMLDFPANHDFGPWPAHLSLRRKDF